MWLGFMRVLREAGVVRALARAVAPLLTRLFPDVPPDHPAMGAMLLNLAANVLGLGNAATPFGLKAMRELETLNPRPRRGDERDGAVPRDQHLGPRRAAARRDRAAREPGLDERGGDHRAVADREPVRDGGRDRRGEAARAPALVRAGARGARRSRRRPTSRAPTFIAGLDRAEELASTARPSATRAGASCSGLFAVALAVAVAGRASRRTRASRR